jgi:hypothetical protein
MFLAGFVVAQDFLLQHLFQQLFGNLLCPAWLRFGALHAKFENVVRGARVAIRKSRHAEQNFLLDLNGLISQPVLLVCESTPQQFDNLRRGQRIEHVDLSSGEQRRDDLERRIFRRRANEQNVTRLDIRQKCVLLSLVEAVHFIDENNGALAAAGTPLCFGHHFLDFFDTAQYGAEGDELTSRQPRDQTSQSRLSTSRRPPKEHGA